VTTVDVVNIGGQLGVYRQDDIRLLRVLVEALSVQRLIRLSRRRMPSVLRFACLLPDRRVQCFSLEGCIAGYIDHLEPLNRDDPLNCDWRAVCNYRVRDISVFDSLPIAEQVDSLDHLRRWESLLSFRGIPV
jgi:hypothetical protein